MKYRMDETGPMKIDRTALIRDFLVLEVRLISDMEEVGDRESRTIIAKNKCQRQLSQFLIYGTHQ